MTSKTIQNALEEAIAKLLYMAKELTWNKLSENCKFIVTEIRDSKENFHEQRSLMTKENNKKTPVALDELMPTIQNLYNSFYDINLYIYQSTKSITVIDIRYYSKSSLDNDYRQKLIANPPMLHCKVSMPPWLADKKEKFDINWEHNEELNKWRLFWLRLKLKIKSG